MKKFLRALAVLACLTAAVASAVPAGVNAVRIYRNTLLMVASIAYNPQAADPDGAASTMPHIWYDKTTNRYLAKDSNGVIGVMQSSQATIGWEPVTCATTTTLATNTYAAPSITVTATGAQTVDGVALTAGMRVLVKNESNSKNGIYVVSTAGATGVQLVLTRASDANVSGSFEAGKIVTVQQGTVNANLVFEFTTTTFTLDTTTGAWSAPAIDTIGSGNNPVTVSTGTGSLTVSSTAATARAGVRNASTRNIIRNGSVAVPDCTGATLNLTVTQFLDAGIATCGTVQTVNFPTWQGAAGIVQGLPGAPAVGDIVEFLVVASAANALTVGAGTGGTLGGSATVPANTDKLYRCRITAITANSETATCY